MTRRRVGRLVPSFLLGSAVFIFSPHSAHAQKPPTATIKYDEAGHVVTTLYTDQTCVVNKYNAQGNRIATTVTKADIPETSVWGSGVWGCSEWNP